MFLGRLIKFHAALLALLFLFSGQAAARDIFWPLLGDNTLAVNYTIDIAEDFSGMGNNADLHKGVIFVSKDQKVSTADDVEVNIILRDAYNDRYIDSGLSAWYGGTGGDYRTG